MDDLRRTGSRSSWSPGTPTTATARRRNWPRAGRRPARAPAGPSGYDGHCRRPDPRAGRRLPGRGQAAGGADADAGRLDHVHRPGPGRDHHRQRERARLRARTGRRQPALHAGRGGRRRADEDDPYRARRRPAVLDAAAARRVPRDGRRRSRSSRCSRTCRSCSGSRARSSASATAPRPSATTGTRASCRRRSTTTWRCSAGRRGTTGSLFTLARDGRRVRPGPGQQERRPGSTCSKLEAINGDKIRELDPADFVRRIIPFLQRGPGWSATRPSAEQAAVVDGRRAADPGADLEADRGARHAALPARGRGQVRRRPGRRRAVRSAPTRCPCSRRRTTRWPASGRGPPRTIRDALQAALVDGLGLKPRAAFGGAVRVAITGRRVGPPLFESIELLGRERTLDRLAQAAAAAAAERLRRDAARGGSLWPPRPHFGYTALARRTARRARASLARSHGVWGNWQPDGFWPR